MNCCQMAAAEVRGDGIWGAVRFRRVRGGTLVTADIRGMPDGFHGFHIHTGTDCGGVDFADAMGHYNPTGAQHPNHAGDLPPLLSSGGRAFLSLVTGRFTVPEVMGRTVIIHRDPDDFHTQPSGNSGPMIACGVIRRI